MSEFYSPGVKAEIFRDLTRLKNTRYRGPDRLYWSCSRRGGASPDELKYYIVDYTRGKYQALYPDEDPDSIESLINRAAMTRLSAFQKLPDEVIGIIILFIDMHSEQDYREIAYQYRCEPEPEDEDTPARAPEPPAQTSVAVSALGRSIDFVDSILQSRPFSAWLFSAHVAFAAFYIFAAIAFTWGIGGIADLGANTPLLPGPETGAAQAAAPSGSAATVDKRFSVLVLIFVIFIFSIVFGLTAWLNRKRVGHPRESLGVLAIVTASACFAMLWLSNTDTLFAGAYAVYAGALVVLAHKTDWRQAVGLVFPVGLLGAVAISVAVSLIHPSAPGPGGILPALAFLMLLLGGLSGQNRGALLVAAFATVATVFFSALNIIYFKNWFRLDPWDPGTVSIFLLIPVANGLWDWVSLSITRKITRNAVDEAKNEPVTHANLRLLRAALLDTALAVLMVAGLFITIRLGGWAYNNFLHGGQVVFSVDPYFEAFQQSIFSARSFFVLSIVITVFLPTLLHLSVALHSFIRPRAENPSAYAVIGSFGFLLLAAGAILLLFIYFARTAIDLASIFL